LLRIRVGRELVVLLPVSVLAALTSSATTAGLIIARSAPTLSPPGHDYPCRPRTGRFQ